MYLRTYVSMYVSMYVCMYVCMYVYMHVWMDVSMYQCIKESMYQCINAYSIHIYIYMYIYTHSWRFHPELEQVFRTRTLRARIEAAPCFPSSGLVINKTSSRCKSGSSFQRPNMKNNKRNSEITFDKEQNNI